MLDLVIGGVGCILLTIAIPCVWIGNLVANQGPLFFRQKRVGKDGRIFEIIKFRTMVSSAGDSGGEWTSRMDPRVTPFGQMLRSLYVDELPQFLNVLRGDLSVVGPRPEQPHYVEKLSRELRFYSFRQIVRPGLTGWAQINQGYASDAEDALEKLQYEFFYLRRQSLSLDVRIIARTIRRVLQRAGR